MSGTARSHTRLRAAGQGRMLDRRGKGSSARANARLLVQLDRLDAAIQRRQRDQEVEPERGGDRPERPSAASAGAARPPPRPTEPPPRPRWWHAPKQWPVPTDAEIDRAVEALMADPVNGPAQVSDGWIERYGTDGLGPLVARWKACRAGS